MVLRSFREMVGISFRICRCQGARDKPFLSSDVENARLVYDSGVRWTRMLGIILRPDPVTLDA